MSHMPNTSCFTVFGLRKKDKRPRLASRSIAEMLPCFFRIGAKKRLAHGSVCVHDARFCFAMCVPAHPCPATSLTPGSLRRCVLVWRASVFFSTLNPKVMPKACARNPDSVKPSQDGSPFLKNRIHQWVFRKSWCGEPPNFQKVARQAQARSLMLIVSLQLGRPTEIMLRGLCIEKVSTLRNGCWHSRTITQPRVKLLRHSVDVDRGACLATRCCAILATVAV